MYLITESGLNDKAPYDPALLAFHHEGVEIRNPYLSPCGRFEVDPVAIYGFEEQPFQGLLPFEASITRAVET